MRYDAKFYNTVVTANGVLTIRPIASKETVHAAYGANSWDVCRTEQVSTIADAY